MLVTPRLHVGATLKLKSQTNHSNSGKKMSMNVKTKARFHGIGEKRYLYVIEGTLLKVR